jgi:hypothetical protein
MAQRQLQYYFFDGQVGNYKHVTREGFGTLVKATLENVHDDMILQEFMFRLWVPSELFGYSRVVRFFNPIHARNSYQSELMTFAGRLYEMVVKRGLQPEFTAIMKEAPWPFVRNPMASEFV